MAPTAAWGWSVCASGSTNSAGNLKWIPTAAAPKWWLLCRVRNEGALPQYPPPIDLQSLPGSWRAIGLQLLAEIAGHASSRRYIAFQGIIHHHAIGVEAPAQGPDGALHALDPAAREAVAVAVVVERNHFFAQHAVQIVSIAIIVNAHVGMSSAGSDGESVQAVVGLCPPAVEN